MNRPASWLRPSACVFLIVLTFGVSGCSRIEAAYNWADVLIKWRVGRRLKLSSPAKADLSAAVDRYHRWHRESMLPRYAETARRIARGVREEEEFSSSLDENILAILGLFLDTFDPVVGPYARALDSLDDSGIGRLETRMAGSNKRVVKNYLADPAKAAKRRAKRAIKDIEMFTGRLDRGQRERVRELLLRYPWDGASWLTRQKARQKKLITLLRGKKGVSQVEAHVRSWWLRHGKDSERRRKHFADSKGYLIELRAILTGDQILKIARTLADYADKFDRMALKYAGKK